MGTCLDDKTNHIEYDYNWKNAKMRILLFMETCYLWKVLFMETSKSGNFLNKETY